MTQIESSRFLVTGGASGIGRLMALELARRGGRPIIWDLHEDGLRKVGEELEQVAGEPALTVQCDVSSREQVKEAAERVEQEWGGVDILVNNAGVVSGKPLLEISDASIERTLRVNILSLFWTTRAFLPGMLERDRGHVVTIASAAGWVGVRGLSDYSASKFAAVGFDESLRAELKNRGSAVRTTVICPYYIDTGMFDGVKTRFSSILPILEPEKVSRKVVDAIERDRPRLMMPPIVYTVPLLRALPLSAFDFISNLLGVNASMDEFRGRHEEE